MHNIIDNFQPEICILTEENQKYLQFFETGKSYPEKGLGDYIKSDEAIHDLITGDGVSYIVFQKDDNDKVQKVIAFFSLQASAISYMYQTVDEEEGIYEAMCSIPAVKINMFGVSVEYQDLFYDGVPISALVFRTIIDIISKKSTDFAGIKAVYLHSLKSAESFYIRNDMLYAEKYMIPYVGEDKELTVMYKFIRDVEMVHEEKTHKRRVRYSGTHPKKFAEKYKEHQPEKYADTIEKVISKGSTPASTHISICVNEIIDFLQIKPGQKGLDATLGYGGHTKAMANCLEGKGHMYSLDVDPIELVKTRERLAKNGFGEEILTIIEENFANIDKVAKEHGKFNFLLADLGVSSMQIDNPDRGFSYKIEGPLDLRLNPTKGVSAAERLKDIDESELCGMLIENADEVYASEIASRIVWQREKGMLIETTSQLAECIERVVLAQEEVRGESKNAQKELVKKSCQRTFQALRIDVNQEFEVLHQFLEKLPDIMEADGRIAILTFHSGEDRLVKKSFKELYKAGIYSEIATEVIRPSAEECMKNPRARSTKMRWAIKK